MRKNAGGAGGDDTSFARILRAAIQRRGISLRTLRQRLGDRGHVVSVATLSLWQCGSRKPGTGASADVVRELEDLLGLAEDELASTLRPHRRVPADRNVPFARFMGLAHNEVTDESGDRELSERSTTLLSYVDGEGRLVRDLVRNVWQARVDGAQQVAVFATVEADEIGPPSLRGVIGCDLVDTVVDMDQRVIRPTLRLHAPLRKGELALTEWEAGQHRYADGAMSDRQGVVAVRPEAEVGVFVYFDPGFLPRRCWVTVQDGESERVFPATFAGACASHVEFDFGPGSIIFDWEW